jgi:hypothetical protein
VRRPGAGADLAWRVKNGAKSVPLKTLETLPDGSELVMLHESDGMRVGVQTYVQSQVRAIVPRFRRVGW